MPDFIRNLIAEYLKDKHQKPSIVTRFPPEPNGFLHIGHAKSICLNFGIARENKDGICHLRFDDTNPIKEEFKYIDAIKKDIEWLGFKWHGDIRYASNYFEQFYECAIQLIKKGKAYVCSLSSDEIRTYRGTLKQKGINSPYRERSIEENLELFQKMKQGTFTDGKHTLRAKIDMSSPNMNLRDPAIYRIRHEQHHQTQDTWCIYPMYDFAHCISDSLEGITHSLCTLEFEDHRPLYNWFLEALEMECYPQQIEFSRLQLEYTITSKRKLQLLVENKIVDGWSDPRMPTISGLRKRGFPAKSIHLFCNRVGISKSESTTDMSILEDCAREELENKALRVMGVLNPLKVIIENYPKDQVEYLDAPYHPNNEEYGTRKLPFSREIYIDQQDFEEIPPPKYKRLSLEKEVRLRYGYVIRCHEVIKNKNTGNIEELRCTYDLNTLGKKPEGRKVKGVIHWVSQEQALQSEIKLYDRLFTKPNPDADKNIDFQTYLNPHSLEILKNSVVEPILKNAKIGDRFQFERVGYFMLAELDKTTKNPIFHRIVTLRDSWQKIHRSSI